MVSGRAGWVALLMACALSMAACQRSEKRTADRRAVEPADTSALADPVPEAESPSQEAKLVLVDSPLRGALITTPVRVTGKARGPWYFEAEFPIRVLDAQSDMIGTGVARAQGDWQTPDFVPFEASIVFRASKTDSTGFLVIEKSNPSGRFQTADEFRVPVRFH